MTRNTSFGDLVSALYDAADDLTQNCPNDTDDLVAACAIDLLLRHRNPHVVAELLDVPTALPSLI